MNNFTIGHHSLPSQPTPFIGREDEIRQIAILLADATCRLLTLVGPGGIGKTRLALAVAEDFEGLSAYPDGIYLVSLQSLATPEFIVPAIAEVLNFQFFSGSKPREQLLNYLGSKSLLLILDNLEHLLDGVDLISDILAAAPRIKVLATTRERLNLLEEWVFDVGGLLFPANDTETDIETYSAVQLFMQNARRVRPGFGLNGEQVAVVGICRLVEGMPLGIELAASWARTLSCHEIARQLERGLDILETPARNMPERHRNMRAVLDQSWTLLPEKEQAVLQRLSVFRGGFTLEAVEAVVGATLAILAALVDKSWLRGDPHGGRYDMHELLRQYTGKQLENSGKDDTVRDAHSEYYADFMFQREKDIKYQRQIPALDEIERDFDNIRAAWDWAIHTNNRPSIDRMLDGLSFFSDMRGRWQEGIELLGVAMEALVYKPDMIWSRLRARRVRLMMLSDAHERIDENFQAQLEDHITLAQSNESPSEIAFGMSELGIHRFSNLDFLQSLQYFEASFVLYCSLDDRFYMGQVMVYIGMGLGSQARTREQFVGAKSFLLQSLAYAREVDAKNEMSWTAFQVGEAAFDLGEYAEADRYFRESEAYQRECGSMKALSYSLVERSRLVLWIGQLEQAKQLAEEGLKIIQYWNISALEDAALVGVGLAKIMLEDYEGGEPLCRRVSVWALRDPTSFSGRIALLGVAMASYHVRDNDAVLRDYHTSIEVLRILSVDMIQHEEIWMLAAPIGVLLLSGIEQYEHAIRLLSRIMHMPHTLEYPTMSWLEKAPLFVRLRVQLEAELGYNAYNVAWEQGKTFDIEKTIHTLLNDFPHSFGDLVSTTTLVSQPSRDSLTARELEILELVAAGLSNSQIARQLVLAVGTVKWYISEIYSKLGVNSRTQAIARARELKLLP